MKTPTTSKDHIQVTFNDGRTVSCPVNTPVDGIEPLPRAPDGMAYLGAVVNNDVVSLSYPLEVDSSVQLLTLANPHGWRIYRRSVSFLLAKTVKELFPDAQFAVEHSLGTGFFCTFDTKNSKGSSTADLAAIEARMREYVTMDLPISRMKISYASAVRRFQQEEQHDKLNLLQFRNPPKVVVYCCNGFSDLSHGPVAPRTGLLGHFKIRAYEPGFVIQFPERDDPPYIAPFEPQPHLFEIFKDHKEWGRILGVQTVGDLNEAILHGEVGDFIKIAEAFHEKKMVQTADHIFAHRDRIKWILIAGPSSAGKTTTSKRLAVQLRVNGLRPVMISVDDYFVDRDATPRTETGDYDFENVETIDLALLNDHLKRLDEGEEVELPRFNFESGQREYRGHKLRIEDDQMVIIEGIHCLNPRLTQTLPPEHKFKIYVSALTQLNMDFNNRISTTDNRLLRRMIRDNMFRGNTALMTLKMWPNVRRGEKKWIFPFQQEADIALNTALDYELAVLKRLAEPLLLEVKPYHMQYAEARRLTDFLDCFMGVSAEHVPPTSILREFIGESSFRY